MIVSDEVFKYRLMYSDRYGAVLSGDRLATGDGGATKSGPAGLESGATRLLTSAAKEVA
jgi:hypothetical protein